MCGIVGVAGKVTMKEEKAFGRTVLRGVKHLRTFIDGGLTGDELFMLHDTYGFPVELSVEIAKREQIKLDPDWRQAFDIKMQEQRTRSQTAAKGRQRRNEIYG